MPGTMALNDIQLATSRSSLDTLYQDPNLQSMVATPGMLMQIIDAIAALGALPNLVPAERAWIAAMPASLQDSIRACVHNVAANSELYLNIVYSPTTAGYGVTIYQFDNTVTLTVSGPATYPDVAAT